MSSSQTLIDRFITALWLEDGLAANSQAAYKRDIGALQTWLALPAQKTDLLGCQSHHLQAYMAARAGSSKASSSNRRLAAFKRFFQWAVREHLRPDDPTIRLLGPKASAPCPTR